jgi:phosphoketolase
MGLNRSRWLRPQSSNWEESEDEMEKISIKSEHLKQFLRDKLVERKQYAHEHGDDMPEVKNWSWPY